MFVKIDKKVVNLPKWKEGFFNELDDIQSESRGLKKALSISRRVASLKRYSDGSISCSFLKSEGDKLYVYSRTIFLDTDHRERLKKEIKSFEDWSHTSSYFEEIKEALKAQEERFGKLED